MCTPVIRSSLTYLQRPAPSGTAAATAPRVKLVVCKALQYARRAGKHPLTKRQASVTPVPGAGGRAAHVPFVEPRSCSATLPPSSTRRACLREARNGSATLARATLALLDRPTLSSWPGCSGVRSTTAGLSPSAGPTRRSIARGSAKERWSSSLSSRSESPRLVVRQDACSASWEEPCKPNQPRGPP